MLRPRPFNVAADTLQASCPHLEQLARRAYERHRDQRVPCGVFVASFFPKGRRLRGRPSTSHEVVVPQGWLQSRWDLREVDLRLVGDPAAWERSLEPVEPTQDRQSDLRWLMDGRRALGQLDSELGCHVQACFEELEVVVERTLAVPAPVLRVWLAGLGWAGLRTSEFASLWVALVARTQLAYVALRLSGRSHGAAWSVTLDRLAGLQPYGGGDNPRRGRWLKQRVADALRNGRRAQAPKTLLACLDVARRATSSDARWPWVSPGGVVLAGADLLDVLAMISVLLELVLDEGPHALPGPERWAPFAPWEPRHGARTLEQVYRAVPGAQEHFTAQTAREFGVRLRLAAQLVAATRASGAPPPEEAGRLAGRLAANSGADPALLGAHFVPTVLPEARERLPPFSVWLADQLSELHATFGRQP